MYALQNITWSRKYYVYLILQRNAIHHKPNQRINLLFYGFKLIYFVINKHKTSKIIISNVYNTYKYILHRNVIEVFAVIKVLQLYKNKLFLKF